MKVSKAIELLTLYMKPSDNIEPVDFDTAIKLGLEALKRTIHTRTLHKPNPLDLLPGETPEDDTT